MDDGTSHYRELRWMFHKIWFKFPERVSLKTLVVRTPFFGSLYPQVVRVPPVKNHCFIVFFNFQINKNTISCKSFLNVLNDRPFSKSGKINGWACHKTYLYTRSQSWLFNLHFCVGHLHVNQQCIWKISKILSSALAATKWWTL